MRMLPVLFSFCLFFAAFLSFSVQPVLGKMLLPMVGGSPSGWIVAMAFFQLSLLAGYGISWGLSRLNPWGHATGLLVLYVAGFVFLPPHLPPVATDTNISFAVMISLARTILIPFLALTATTAALQRVFSATDHPTAGDPYYLFVASNLGSFAGLLIYPFLLEPYTGLKMQAGYWQLIYFVTVALIIIACFLAWKRKALIAVAIQKEQVAPVSLQRILYWLVLAFIPCSLSMGVTTLITTDLGGLPLFWVVPLGLYLLTFVLAFAKKTFVSTEQINFLHILAVIFIIIAVGLGGDHEVAGNIVRLLGFAGILLGIFFIIAWSCHRKLALDRPLPQHLTLYYFIMALGGALAGIMHSFVIPFLLPYVIEFPIMVMLSVFLFSSKEGPQDRRKMMLCCLAGMAALLVVTALKYNGQTSNFILFFQAIFFISVLSLMLCPRLLPAIGFTALAVSVIFAYSGKVYVQSRNFFGPYAVYENRINQQNFLVLSHGNTLHGLQETEHAGRKRDDQLGYYAPDNPIQEVLTAAETKTLAVLGLGAGQMACYAPALTTDFYEIDPDMLQVATDYFAYLKDCPPRDVFIGDGRKEIEKQNRHYDVIIMDAFTSDTVPLHLLTREALRIYRAQLSAHGILLFHVSNRHLRLAPSLANVAKAEGLQAYARIFEAPADSVKTLFSSQWVAIPLNAVEAEKLQATGWKAVHAEGTAWTDDRSSLLPAISLDTKH